MLPAAASAPIAAMAKLRSAESSDTLNSFLSLGRPAWREVRAAVTQLLDRDDPRLQNNAELRSRALVDMDAVQMHLPADIGDYTDFFASKEHASNCGAIFRGSKELQSNWLHLPVAYHGRSSSIVASDTPVRRPRGQVLPADAAVPTLAPCAALDFELEMACLIGPGNAHQDAINADAAEEHIFGVVLMNDWSARDIQKWEYVPLGPFNGKNWATSISPWVVTLDALEAFRCDAPPQDPPILPYLQEARRASYDIHLEVAIQPTGAPTPTVVSCSNFKYLYWTLPQMVAHHTVGGCPLRPGDLIGTGTISSPKADGLGSMLELSWSGKRKVPLQVGQERTFIEDHDTVIMTGYCQGDGYRVGFGECRNTVLPAH